MLKRKKNKVTIHNYIIILLLTVLLIISLSYGWYTNNKHVNANGIHGEISEGNIGINFEGVYKHEVGAKEPVHPYPDEMPDMITGLLSGEYVYYSISIISKDDVIKDLKIKINNADGGEYFTIAPIETTIDEYDLYENVEANDTYLLGVEVEEDGKIKYETVSVPTYIDTTTTDPNYLYKEFYFHVEDDIYYKNYFYEDENGKRYNMLDVYTIELHSVYFGTKENGYHKINSSDGNVIDFSDRGNLNKIISSVEVATYENWNSQDSVIIDDNEVSTAEITFTFKISFDYSSLAEKININCISNKKLIFNNFLVFATESNSGGES